MSPSSTFKQIRKEEEALPLTHDHRKGLPQIRNGYGQERWRPLSLSGFVPAFEGLRGVAVVMTCISHIAPDHTRFQKFEGTGGVTIFFLLSGFLISGVLLKMQKKDSNYRFSHLKQFYYERNIRLFPALVMMIVLTGLVQIIRLGGIPYNLGWQTLYALTYTTNFNQASLRGNTNFLWQNLWSLCVEEQFYIIFALALPCIVALQQRTQTYILVILVSISFLLNYGVKTQLETVPAFLNYTNPFCHFWKLLLGAFLRLTPLPIFSRSIWIGRAGIFILTCTTASMLTATAYDLTYLGFSERFFGYKVYDEPIAALSTALIILGVAENGNWLLELQPLRFIGRVSYSFYLYQLPLLHWEKHTRNYAGLGITALAFTIAMFSTLQIEEPIRQRYRGLHHK